MIADEVRSVPGDHDSLTQMAIGEGAHLADHVRTRLGRRDDFQQMQVARRIEEVGAEPMAAEVVAAALGERMNRNAGCIRADDRSGAPGLIDPGEQGPLHVELFDDGFDDPIGFGESLKSLIKAGCGDELPGVRREERIRFERASALEPFRGCFGRHVE